MTTGSSDPSSLDCFASPPRRAPLDDLSNIQKALLDVEKTPDRGINVAEGWEGKHDLTPISKTETLPPLKRTKSKQRSGSTKKKRKEALINIVGQVIREDCKGKVTARELETAVRESIESDCTKEDHFIGLETITNQSLVGAVRKIVKTATYDFRTKTLVVDELAVERNTSKTADFKCKQALASLALLMNVTNQRWSNDIPFILALAVVSYGAGEMFLTFLNNIGLTVSWQTL